MRHISTSPNVYHDLLQSGTIHVTGLEGTRFSLCHISIVPEGSEGRQVSGGPMVPGPWGFTTAHALVIDTAGGSAREREGAIQVAAGENFTVEGLPGVWTFRSPDRRKAEGDGPKLQAVEVQDYVVTATVTIKVAAPSERDAARLATEIVTDAAARSPRIAESDQSIEDVVTVPVCGTGYPYSLKRSA